MRGRQRERERDKCVYVVVEVHKWNKTCSILIELVVLCIFFFIFYFLVDVYFKAIPEVSFSGGGIEKILSIRNDKGTGRIRSLFCIDSYAVYAVYLTPGSNISRTFPPCGWHCTRDALARWPSSVQKPNAGYREQTREKTTAK